MYQVFKNNKCNSVQDSVTCQRWTWVENSLNWPLQFMVRLDEGPLEEIPGVGVWGQGGRGRSKHEPPPQPGVCLITYSLKGFRPPFFLLSASQQRQKAAAEGCAGLMPVILRHSAPAAHRQPSPSFLWTPSCLFALWSDLALDKKASNRCFSDPPISSSESCMIFLSPLCSDGFKPPFTHLICLLQISPLHLPLPYSRTTYLGSLLLKESDPDSSDHQHTVPTQLPPNPPLPSTSPTLPTTHPCIQPSPPVRQAAFQWPSEVPSNGKKCSFTKME